MQKIESAKKIKKEKWDHSKPDGVFKKWRKHKKSKMKMAKKSRRG